MGRIPVTVVTGYLGAGKTTLLRRIARENSLRLAIIMNEFGEIPIDSRVIEGKNITMAELAGGCVCCSLCGEFSLAVAELLETVKPQWIVVETSGAAEPAALAHDIRENVPGIRLDSIVTVVDADAMIRFPSLGHTGREQIELADLIIINKVDLVDKDTLGRVREAVGNLNSHAATMDAVRCGIETAVLFGVARNTPSPAHKPHHVEVGHFEFTTEKVLDHGALLHALKALPEGIFRAKGFARTSDGCFLINYVAGRLELEERACGKTELVFMGKGAGKSEAPIRKALESIPGAIWRLPDRDLRAGDG